VDEATRAAQAAGGGDPAAIAAFIRATQAEVWRLCAHLVDDQTADDLTQATYLRALRALPGFRGEASARTWLLSIARRACMDELRTRTRRRAADRLAGGREEPTVADIAGHVELSAMLDDLDADRRAAFVLTQLLGHSYQQAAAICGCPIGTIRSRVARARSALIAALIDAGQPRRRAGD
jgi:RNA polymerase sigma-70 factor (ECF subfamily)